MSSELPRPTDAELRLLDELWRSGPLPVREIANQIYGEPTTVQYRTVQVQLDRLVKKGLIEKDQSVSPQHYAAAFERSQFIGAELQTMADRMCEGSLTPLLLNLAGQAQLDADQKARLRALLEEDGLGEDDDE